MEKGLEDKEDRVRGSKIHVIAPLDWENITREREEIMPENLPELMKDKNP